MPLTIRPAELKEGLDILERSLVEEFGAGKATSAGDRAGADLPSWRPGDDHGQPSPWLASGTDR
jgi:hypothetical protein